MSGCTRYIILLPVLDKFLHIYDKSLFLLVAKVTIN
jgi:hypothetical protein